MSKNMKFLPKHDLLSSEELFRLVSLFVSNGITKLRLTGGEPLVRRGAIDLIHQFGSMLNPHKTSGHLNELTMTTNGTQLGKYADDLVQAGIKRLNVSLDTLRPKRYSEITRIGKIDQVFKGLEAAKDAGLKIKLNTVALKNFNDDEYDDLIEYCGDMGFDLTLIEVMPMGDTGISRGTQFLPLTEIKQSLSKRWTLTPSTLTTGGPARYMHIGETDQKIGFISPLTGNFCDGCNRIRLTCTGKLYMCLGQEDMIDFRHAMRAGAQDSDLLGLINMAMHKKPFGHDFSETAGDLSGGSVRHMSVTGG